MGKRTFILTCLLLFSASVLFSQSLVDLAKKEKERRSNLNGKKGKVVTYADIASIKVQPALSSTPSASNNQPVQAAPTTSPQVSDRENLQASRALEQQWETSSEYVDLLTLKINHLQQKFFSFRDWTVRDKIQRDMYNTFLKLQDALGEEQRARQNLERFRKQRKRSRR